MLCLLAQLTQMTVIKERGCCRNRQRPFNPVSQGCIPLVRPGYVTRGEPQSLSRLHRVHGLDAVRLPIPPYQNNNKEKSPARTNKIPAREKSPARTNEIPAREDPARVNKDRKAVGAAVGEPVVAVENGRTVPSWLWVGGETTDG